MAAFEIDPDIRRAEGLPAEVYRDPAWLDLQRERVFARSWQWLPEGDGLAAPADSVGSGRVVPATLLPGCLDEPVVLSRQGAVVRCFSNVCTHRGNLVVQVDGDVGTLRCRYHGRRFGLDGRLLAMPEFDGVEAFPSAADDLARVAHATWGPFHFASVRPACPFEALVAPLGLRLGDDLLARLAPDPAASRDYRVRANWALYVDNYLEGFHIPFVHAALADVLDYGGYRTELHPWGVLQVGVARAGEDCFDSPVGAERVAAWYAWFFPNTMFNFYPWGLSINVVVPVSHAETRVLFRTYVRDPARRARDTGAGAGLHQVELEDEAVVEAVQRGVASRLYRRGRYSPTRETGVHHFHRLLARCMADVG